MSGTIIIEGNSVYEIDEECMLKKRLAEKEEGYPDEKRRSASREHPEDTRSKNNLP